MQAHSTKRITPTHYTAAAEYEAAEAGAKEPANASWGCISHSLRDSNHVGNLYIAMKSKRKHWGHRTVKDELKDEQGVPVIAFDYMEQKTEAGKWEELDT